jgi:hypothetical protein
VQFWTNRAATPTSNLSFGRNIKLLPFAEAVTKINEFMNPGRTRPAAAAA